MLASNAILNEIRQLHRDGQTGLLVLVGKDGERVEVFFREGMIEAVSSNLPGYRLGDYLAKKGSIPVRDLDAADSEARRQKIFFGEAVVRGRLMNLGEVAAAAREQSTELVERVVNGGFSVDSFSNCLRSYTRANQPHRCEPFTSDVQRFPFLRETMRPAIANVARSTAKVARVVGSGI